MKKLLIPLLLLSFILVGCGSNTTSKLTMTSDQIFEKKQECAGYRDKMTKEAELSYRVYGDYYSQLDGPAQGFGSIEEIFYSLKENICMYVYHFFSFDTADKAIESFEIFDYFSKKDIGGISGPAGFANIYSAIPTLSGETSGCSTDMNDKCKRLGNKIQELKGE